MDIRAFWSSVIGNCIWPFTVMLALILFKKSIHNLLTKWKSIKYKNFELISEIEDKIKNTVSNQIIPEETISNDKSITDSFKKAEGGFMGKFKYYMKLAETSIPVAINDAWLIFEKNAYSILNKNHPDIMKKPLQFNDLIDALYRNNYLNKEDAKQLINARDIRNTIIHKIKDPKLPIASVAEYAMMILNYADRLEASASVKEHSSK